MEVVCLCYRWDIHTEEVQIEVCEARKSAVHLQECIWSSAFHCATWQCPD